MKLAVVGLTSLVVVGACSSTNVADQAANLSASEPDGATAEPEDSTDGAVHDGEATTKDGSRKDKSTAPDDAGDGADAACVLTTPMPSSAAPCEKCVGAACCAEYNDCMTDADCNGLWQCHLGCLMSGPSCGKACDQQFAAGIAKSDALKAAVEKARSGACASDCK